MCVLGGFLVLTSAISANQAIFIGSYERKTARTETSVRELQAKHKEATGLMNRIAQDRKLVGFQSSLLERRQAFLQKQYNFGHHWAMTLKELKRLVPEGIWLTGIKTEDYYLKIAGGALEEKGVSDFMAILRKSPAFSNVLFNYTKSSRVGTTDIIVFELTCNYNLQFMVPEPES